MTLRFRNVDGDPSDPVDTWPTEAVIAALERGGLSEWRRLAPAVRRDPWGPVARHVEDALHATHPYGVGELMATALERARAEAEAEERAEVARRLRTLFARSGLSGRAFAERIGTSSSRLSTYLDGRVAPSSTLMVRMERVAGLEPHEHGLRCKPEETQ